MIVGMLEIFLIVGILPFLCGLWFVKKGEIESGKIATAYVFGYMTMFALFQVVFTISQILTNRLEPIVTYFTVAIVVLALNSTIYAHKEFSLIYKNLRELVKEKKPRWVYVSGVICVLLLLVPIVMSFVLQYADGDDSYYLALATQIESNGILSGVLPYTGGTSAIDARHAWAGGVTFTSYLARITGLHTAVVAHLLLPPFLMVIMYMIYWLIAKVLLKDKKEYISLFMITIVLMYIFGNVSIYTATTFMITRTWQGKAMFSNLIVPILILCFLMMKEYGGKPIYWVGVTIVGIASVFASTMGIFFTPVFVGLATFVIAIAYKKWKYLIGYIISMVPVLGYAVLYVLD
jgi:hypothetical protein